MTEKTELRMPRPGTKSYTIVKLRERGLKDKEIAEVTKTSPATIRVLFHKYKNREATNIANRDWARKNPEKIQAQRARALERRPDMHSYNRYRRECRLAGVDPLVYEVWKESRGSKTTS